jgi:phospholipid/cholesterol/gamma-HCH transport system substrate-binding protein
MTQDKPVSGRGRWLRVALAAALLVMLAVGVYQVWPTRSGNKLTAYFSNAVGLYQGDEVRVVGVPVGTIDSIEPRATDVKITMTIGRDVKLPADAKAIIISPNLVAARFIQLTPAYTKGAVMADGASVGLDRTGVPVEWDEVKEQLTQLSTQLGPREGSMQGPLAQVVNQAAATFDGNGDSFRNALRELSQTAGRLGDSRTDLFGTIKNLQILVDALSNSNEQIVQFTNHVASVSQVLAQSSSGLDTTLATLNQALGDVRGLLHDSNDALISQVSKLADFTQILTDHSDDIEQVLHVTPNGLANFYNIYNPAQGTVDGLLSLPNFANPVQFICGGTFDVGATPDDYKRAEICRQRMGPVLKRITMNYPPVLFHPINSIVAYKGQIIYDTPQTQAKSETPVPYLQWQNTPGVTPPQVPTDATLSSLMVPPAPAGAPGTSHAGGPAAPAPAAADQAPADQASPAAPAEQAPVAPAAPAEAPAAQQPAQVGAGG